MFEAMFLFVWLICLGLASKEYKYLRLLTRLDARVNEYVARHGMEMACKLFTECWIL